MGESPKGDIREAIAEAVSQSDYLDAIDGETDVFPAPGEPSAGSPVTEGETIASDDDPALSGEAEAQEGTAEEPPTEYWGTSLEGLSAEQRTAVIAALEQRDSTIQQLQQRLTQEPTPPQIEEEEPPAEITDDDLLRALGLDPESGDQFELEYARKFSLPLARQVMALEDTVEVIQQAENVRQVSNYWNTELDRLEKEYGALPGNRVSVLQYAADENIPSPEALYFRVTAPVRKQVDAEVAKIRQQAAKRSAAGGVRPRSTDAGTKVLDTEGKTLRQTVREAAVAAQEETGFSWKEVLRRK